MNVIFLDIDGVLITRHLDEDKDVEEKVKILADICKEYECKIVIESSWKEEIDEETLETDIGYINKIFSLFRKYGIECIGRTPTLTENTYNEDDSFSEGWTDEFKSFLKRNGIIPPFNYEKVYTRIWKEYEILMYLEKHPEITHYCIIDDDDNLIKSDLDLLREYLVKPEYYSKNHNEEGLLERHKEEVEKIIKK